MDVANGRPAGNNAGKLWMMIGLLIAVFGLGMTFMTNTMNENKIDALTKQCEDEGGKAIVSKDKKFLSTNYAFECKK
ncbi:hypothetical protein ACIQXI_02715 [Lysinibacillus sp. NPDC097195]|uniref:hypothetical protein n=1 Tax=Lysinibacillus sp. NPDC097195 TaxID=3364141 RepID=UPI0037FA6048